MERKAVRTCFIAFAALVCLGIPGQARADGGKCDGSATTLHRKIDSGDTNGDLSVEYFGSIQFAGVIAATNWSISRKYFHPQDGNTDDVDIDFIPASWPGRDIVFDIPCELARGSAASILGVKYTSRRNVAWHTKSPKLKLKRFDPAGTVTIVGVRFVSIDPPPESEPAISFPPPTLTALSSVIPVVASLPQPPAPTPQKLQPPARTPDVQTPNEAPKTTPTNTPLTAPVAPTPTPTAPPLAKTKPEKKRTLKNPFIVALNISAEKAESMGIKADKKYPVAMFANQNKKGLYRTRERLVAETRALDNGAILCLIAYNRPPPSRSRSVIDFGHGNIEPIPNELIAEGEPFDKLHAEGVALAEPTLTPLKKSAYSVLNASLPVKSSTARTIFHFIYPIGQLGMGMAMHDPFIMVSASTSIFSTYIHGKIGDNTNAIRATEYPSLRIDYELTEQDKNIQELKDRIIQLEEQVSHLLGQQPQDTDNTKEEEPK